MSGESEIELKFLVPREARAAVLAEMTRRSASLERRTLAAMYLDTPDRRLAAAGIAWRLRREGRRWVQTLKSGGASAIERFEHEVIRPGPSHDAALHAGTRTGDKLAKILRSAQKDGLDVGVRFKTQVRRIARRIRTQGAVVEVAFDEGSVLADAGKLRIGEVEFELYSGSATGLLALAERWRRRFGLVYDPRSKAARGDRLAAGARFPPPRKAVQPEYSSDASAVEAFGKVVDECLAHISWNAIGLVDGDRHQHVEHVHQLRVGIRRLRSALRSFRGWVPAPPDQLVDELKHLFSELGRARDSDVLDSGVAAELEKVGAPALTLARGEAGPDPVATVGAAGTQKMLLAWLAWRVQLAEAAAETTEPVETGPDETGPVETGPDKTGPDTAAAPVNGDGASVAAAEVAAAARSGLAAEEAASDGSELPSSMAATEEAAGQPPADAGLGEPVAQIDLQPDGDDGKRFQRKAQRRLGQWHRQIAAAWKAFDDLEEEDLHTLRKRIKRQRYAVEFFAPVLRRRDVERYLKPLASVQDRMGELNDLFVARTRYQGLVASDPAAWFALGWLAARVAEVRMLAKPKLKLLAKADPPAG
jgi:inorganic triphosphatase YgiF